MDSDKIIELEPLSDIETMFVESYLCNNFNKAQAARDAGISEHSARQQGWQIYNRENVKSHIEKILKERVLSSAENIKLISDTAQSNLTDYYKPVVKVRSNKIKVGLQYIIDLVQNEIDFEVEYKSQVSMSAEKAKEWLEMQNSRRDKILRYQIELRRNPEATRIIDSEPELVEEMELDINALVADKERGKVKSIAYTQTGLKVEMYSAADAQDKIAKMHGDYEKDNDQKKSQIQIVIGGDDAKLGE